MLLTVLGGSRNCRRGMHAAVALMVTRISDDRSVQSATAPSSMAWTSGCCRADGVGDSNDDGSDKRCRCSTGRVLLTLTSGCCRADGVGESDDDGSDERCRCSTGRRWGLPRVAGSRRLQTQATMWM